MQSHAVGIGSSKNCSVKCGVLSKQQLNKSPHKGQHDFMAVKQLPINLTRCNILNVGILIKKYQQIIRELTQKVKAKIEVCCNRFIISVQQMFCSCLVAGKSVLSDELLKTYLKLISFEYEDLTCQEVSLAFSSIGATFDHRESEAKVCAGLQKYKQKLAKIEQQLVPSSVFVAQNKRIPSFFENQQSSSDQSSSQNKISIRHEQVQFAQSRIIIQNQQPQFKQGGPLLAILDQTSFNVNSTDDSLRLSNITIKFWQKQQYQPNNGTIINALLQSRVESEEILSQRQQPQDGFQQQQQKQQQREEHQKYEERGFFTDNRKNTKYQQNFKKKEDIAMTKMQPYNAMTKQIKQIKQQSSSKQSASTRKSCKPKNPKIQYITIKDLQQNARYIQKPETNEFNIKLKIRKIIIFKFQKQIDSSSQDSVNSRYHKINEKVKFIGGDQSGIIVCNTRYTPEIAQGKYIVLKQCQLFKYKSVSYEIVCDKYEASKQKLQFYVKVKESLSKLWKFNGLVYNLQSSDAKWPSIIGLSRWNPNQGRPFQVIAQIHSIITEDNQQLNCYLSDGTGKIYAIIKKQKDIEYTVGRCYYFKKLKTTYSAQGKLMLTINSTNKPRCVEDMNYGNIEDVELVDIYRQYDV